MSIRILSPAVQQRIAAGEVVERPASVVKELIENTLDAAADTIRVEIQEGGRRLIKVTDDGPGMSAADAPLAFERFATSKIASENDIYAVRTFGFRGEALPSIASVSRVRVLTRERSALLGTEARLEGGKLVSLQEAGAALGTTVEVWDLFYNTPARRKFLRSLRTEYGHILGVFTRFALAFPEKSFALSFDGREVYTFPPTSLPERITACFGREAASGLEVTRAEQGYAARFISRTAIFPCIGARELDADRRLWEAFAQGGWEPVRSLRRDQHEPALTCWLHGDGFCLSTSELKR